MAAPNGRKAIKAMEKVENDFDLFPANDSGVDNYNAQPETKKIAREKEFEKFISLKHDFTGEEKKEISSSLAREVLSKDRLVAEKKSMASQFDSKIKACEAIISGDAERLRCGYEYRATKCKIVIDFIAGTYTEIRLDTGEIINQRELNPSEEQLSMI